MADMTSQRLEADGTLLRTRQGLIEFITKAVSDAQGLDRTTERGMSPDAAAEQRLPSTRGSRKDLGCVKDLLEHHTQHVYRFRADDHGAEINDQPSFATLASSWESAPTPRPWNSIDLRHFPSVRSGRGVNIYTACTVQCTCAKCNERDPVKLMCEPYRCGSMKGQRPQILVHQLHNDLENRAIVLGPGSEPETYLIPGTHPASPDAMAYNQNVVLRQDEPEEPEPTGSLRSRGQPKRRWTANSIDLRSESPKQPRTDYHQQRPLVTPRPQHPFAGTRQPFQPDLQQAYYTVMGYVVDQEDQDTGLSIMFSNPRLQKYMKSIEAAAERNDAYLFRTMRQMVNEELSKAGFARLPGMQEEP